MEPLVRALRACGCDPAEVKRVHSRILDAGLGNFKYVADKLISAYGKCIGGDGKAKQVFDSTRRRDAVTWNLVISAHAQNGHMEDARAASERMPMHDVITGTTVIRGYAHAGQVTEARRVFSAMVLHDLMSWNTILAAYGQHGKAKKSRRLFDVMPQRDVVSWATLVKAYAHSRDEELDEHFSLAKQTFDKMPAWNTVAWNTALTMYADGHRHAAECKELFGSIPKDARSVVTFTTMISAFTRSGQLREARQVYESMPACDTVSCTSMLKAEATEGGMQQAMSDFESMHRRDSVAWTTLVSAFSQRHLQQASLVFKKMPQWDVVAGNCMVAAYAQHGTVEEAMQALESTPEQNLITWASLVAGFAQNGHAQLALDVFDVMLLEGIGDADELIFLSVLGACSHAGLLEEARSRFLSMIDDHGIAPIVEHYQCMADILGRNGKLQEAEELLETMPFLPSDSAWGSLQAASNVHHDPVRGARAGNRIISLSPDSGLGYALLANLHSPKDIYARKKAPALSAGSHLENSHDQNPFVGTSIEIDGAVHEFPEGEVSACRPDMEETFLMMSIMNKQLKKAGFTSAVLENDSSGSRTEVLSCHSERLAVALGVAMTERGTTLQMSKNKRPCTDCHTSLKLLSDILDRKIILREPGMVHRFCRGKYSRVGGKR